MVHHIKEVMVTSQHDHRLIILRWELSCRWFVATPVKDIASPAVGHDTCTPAYSENAVNDTNKHAGKHITRTKLRTCTFRLWKFKLQKIKPLNKVCKKHPVQQS
jgi:hypothetical protein